MAGLLLEEDENQILKILNINEQKLDHYMELFSQWIVSQKHLPQGFGASCRKKFLVWAKLDFERAKEKFQHFCYNPFTYKEFYTDRILTFEEDIKLALEMIYEIPMPKLTQEGYRVTVAKLYNADCLDILVMTRFLTIYIDYRVHKDAIVAGETVILDMKCMKPHHCTKLFNTTYLNFVKYYALSNPLMVKNVFVVNCHPLLEKGFVVVKSVLPRKIAERIAVLNNPIDLHEFIPPKCLPKDYGGNDKPLDHFQALWEKFWLSQKDFYEELDRCKPTGPIPVQFQACENEFGVDGSFRKLNID